MDQEKRDTLFKIIVVLIIAVIVSSVIIINNISREKNGPITKNLNNAFALIGEQKKRITFLENKISAHMKEQAKIINANLRLQKEAAELRRENKKLLEINKKNIVFISGLSRQLINEKNKKEEFFKRKQQLLEESQRLVFINKELKEKIFVLETEKGELTRQLTAAARKIKNIEQALSKAQKEKEALAGENKRLRINLKICLLANNRMNAKITEQSRQAESVMVGEIYFPTGSARVRIDKIKDIAAVIKRYDPKKYICVLRGGADKQPYQNKSIYRNSRLSISRSLAVEYALLTGYKIKLPIIIEGRGNFFAQPPKNNQKERRVKIIIIKKR